MKVILFGRGKKAEFAQQMCEFLVEHLGLQKSRYFLGVIPLVERKKKNAGKVLYDKRGIGLFILMHRPWIEFVSSIAHEMIHVKQIARGQLKQDEKRKTITWMGTVYTLEKRKSRKHKKLPPYLERPWEIEALSKQDILVRLYEEHLFNYVKKRDRIRKRKALSKPHPSESIRQKKMRLPRI